MSGLQIVVVAIFCGVLILLGGIWTFQTYGIYRFSPAPQSPEDLGLTGVQVVSFNSEDGTTIEAWLAKPKPGRPILLSFFGNFSGIGPSFQRLMPLTEDGTGLVMLHYRGAGGRPGHPSEENFARDARALYDQLDALAGEAIPQDRRFLHGFSLGSGVAVRLATERPFSGVVLEAAIPRLCMYFQRRYHGIPLCHLMWAERFDSIDRIAAIPAPVLFVHGAKDSAVPLAWGRQLHDQAGARKEFVEIAEAGHSDLGQHGLFAAIQEFLPD